MLINKFNFSNNTLIKLTIFYEYIIMPNDLLLNNNSQIKILFSYKQCFFSFKTEIKLNIRVYILI